MKRAICTLTLVLALGAMLTLPALAANPTVTKKVVTEKSGKTVILVRVSAADRNLYGVDISDATGSIQDIAAPKGWLGITDGGRLIFRTGGKPIKAGSTLTFRVYSSNAAAGLSVSFRDVKNDAVGTSRSI